MGEIKTTQFVKLTQLVVNLRCKTFHKSPPVVVTGVHKNNVKFCVGSGDHTATIIALG